MQIALKDVRSMGYKKIFDSFFTSKDDYIKFMKDAEGLYTELSSLKIQPYSVISYWTEINRLDTCALGLKKLILSIEPLIDVNPRTKFAKAKFRNTWNGVWEKFGECNNLPESYITILCELGIKVPVVLSAYKSEDMKVGKFAINSSINSYLDFMMKLADFCNIIVNWYCETQFESLLNMRGKTILDVLEYLSLTSNKDFTDRLATGGSIWD